MTVPVHVLSGFLGSGKTTLLNALLRAPAMQGTAVLVNEIGTVGIDHDLVVGASDDMLLLEGGCLCCQPRGGIADALARLLAVRAPERVLIETSGAAHPVPILETLALAPGLRAHARFAGLVTVVDAVFGAHNLAHHEEARLQVACADHLVISKTDLARGAAGLPALSAALDAANTDARRHTPAAGTAPAALVDDLAAAGGPPARPWPLPDGVTRAHDAAFETVSLEFEGRLEAQAVQEWIGELLDAHGGNLLRLKGLLRLRGHARPAILQCVRDVVHPIAFAEPTPGEERNRIVAIASDIHPELLREALQRLAQAAEPATGGAPSRRDRP